MKLKDLRKRYPEIKATSVKGFLQKLKDAEGLGDPIEAITEATGIKAAVDKFHELTGKDCGCNERKEYLNKKFNYNVHCFAASEYEWFTAFLQRRIDQPKKVDNLDVFELCRLYERIFRDRCSICRGCPSGWSRTMEVIKHLTNVYESYDK